MVIVFLTAVMILVVITQSHTWSQRQKSMIIQNGPASCMKLKGHFDRQSEANSLVTLSFTQKNPYEIGLAYINENKKVQIYYLSRQNIRTAITDPMDPLRWYPISDTAYIKDSGSTMIIRISHEDSSHTHIYFDPKIMRRLLKRSLLVVPPGRESSHVDIDAELKQMLQQA